MIDAGQRRRTEPSRYFGLVEAQRVGLHDVACIQVLQLPSQNRNRAMQGVLHPVLDPVNSPEADEPGNGVDVGMPDGAIQVKLKRNRGKESRVVETETVLGEQGW